uniref:Putative secreted protein n=1 Tax=Amblyomma cajennense TaxID=34607 RepID=A0A023FCY6_AMBCJ
MPHISSLAVILLSGQWCTACNFAASLWKCQHENRNISIFVLEEDNEIVMKPPVLTGIVNSQSHIYV